MPWQQGWYTSGSLREQFTKPALQGILSLSRLIPFPTDLEVLLEDEEEHAPLRGDDGAVEGAAVVGQPREDRVELVVEVLVVDVLRLARLQVVTRLRRRRRVEILRGHSECYTM